MLRHILTELLYVKKNQISAIFVISNSFSGELLQYMTNLHSLFFNVNCVISKIVRYHVVHPFLDPHLKICQLDFRNVAEYAQNV